MRKITSKLRIQRIVLAQITVVVMLLMSGCVLKAVNNTSENMNLYMCVEDSGYKKVVDENGKQNFLYKIDMFGNIDCIRSNDTVILRRNVKEYVPKPTIEPITEDKQKVQLEENIVEEQVAAEPEIKVEAAKTVQPEQVKEYVEVQKKIVVYKPEYIYSYQQPIQEQAAPVEIVPPEEIPAEESKEQSTHVIDLPILQGNPIYYAVNLMKEFVSSTERVETNANISIEPELEQKEQEIINTTDEKPVHSTEHIHDWDEGRITISSSCISEGLMTYVCKACGQMKDKLIEKSEHCYSNGNCLICESPDPNAVYEVHEHSYVYAYEREKPTCTTTGMDIYICSCGETNEVITQALGHSFVNDICSRCGYTEKTVHEHSFVKSYTEKEAQCTQSGVDVYVCSCGEIKREVTTFEHKFSRGRCIYCNIECTHEWFTAEYIPADCHNNGKDTKQCKYCGAVEIENLVAQHCYDSTGRCVICSYQDPDIYTAHGRYLATTAMSEYDKMMDIVNFVLANCHGDCIQYSYAAISAGQQCGLDSTYRHVNQVICPVGGRMHSPDMFIARDGYCEFCGMGNNHHWIRFMLSDGNWYEFDLQGLGAYFAGPNIEIHAAYFNR